MKPAITFSFISICLLFSLFLTDCQGQAKKHTNVGNPCEGCEAIFEYGNKNLTSSDTIPGFLVAEQPMILEGKVFHSDKKTPAKDVIIYAYQTNKAGIYDPANNAKGWGQRHGQHRGWVITDSEGYYRFHTFRPGSYPNSNNPQHIHLTIKEPNLNEYYIDPIHFADDPLLSQENKNRLENLGGSGIVNPVRINDKIVITRNIILGHNIRNYPK